MLTESLWRLERLVVAAAEPPGGEGIPILPPSMLRYLSTLSVVALRMDLSRRDRQEVILLAQCLDYLALGRVTSLRETLALRFGTADVGVQTETPAVV